MVFFFNSLSLLKLNIEGSQLQGGEKPSLFLDYISCSTSVLCSPFRNTSGCAKVYYLYICGVLCSSVKKVNARLCPFLEVRVFFSDISVNLTAKRKEERETLCPTSDGVLWSLISR